jgi:hypothetical protein
MKDGKADAKLGDDLQRNSPDLAEDVSAQKLSRLERLKMKIKKL